MPVSNLVFRTVCGQFYWIFQNFMCERVQKICNKRTGRLKIVWPLSGVQTLAIVMLFAALCFSNNSGPTQTMNTGMCSLCNSKRLFLHEFSFSYLWAIELATVIWFIQKKNPLFILYLGVSFLSFLNGMIRMAHVGKCVFLAFALLMCGDVESNPGPGYGNGGNVSEQCSQFYSQLLSNQFSDRHSRPEDHYNTQAFLEHFRAEMTSTLNDSLTRMETNNRQQGKSIETHLKRVEEKIDQRLCVVEAKQTKLEDTLKELTMRHQKVCAENSFLKDTTTWLTNKCDQLENDNKRNNLIFFGCPVLQNTYESWEESESLIRQIIKEGMGVTDNIAIERAQRHGRVIRVKFTFFKEKLLILSSARKLKESSTFNNVYVQEDFSTTVQEKRRMLLPLQREMRQKGIKADLRFEKLVTRDAVFTYDLNLDQVNQWNRNQPRNIMDRRKQDRYLNKEPRGANISRQQPVVDTLFQASEFPSLQSSQIHHPTPNYPMDSQPVHIPELSPDPQPRRMTRTSDKDEDHRRSDSVNPSAIAHQDLQDTNRENHKSKSQYNLRSRTYTTDSGSAPVSDDSLKVADVCSMPKDAGQKRQPASSADSQPKITSVFSASQKNRSSSVAECVSSKNKPTDKQHEISQNDPEDDDGDTFEEDAASTWD